MKKFFSLFALSAVFIAGMICTSCSHSYNRNYYDVYCVDRITDSEAEYYNSLSTSSEKVLQILIWNRDKPEANRETKKRLNEYEVSSYIKSKNCSDEDTQEIINILKTLQPGEGVLQSFYYDDGPTRYHLYFFFEVVQ